MSRLGLVSRPGGRAPGQIDFILTHQSSDCKQADQKASQHDTRFDRCRSLEDLGDLRKNCAA